MTEQANTNSITFRKNTRHPTSVRLRSELHGMVMLEAKTKGVSASKLIQTILENKYASISDTPDNSEVLHALLQLSAALMTHIRDMQAHTEQFDALKSSVTRLAIEAKNFRMRLEQREAER